MLDDIDDAMLPVAQLQVTMNEENFILYAYKVNSSPLPTNVEVFMSSVHGVGLRVSRDFAAGETVLEVHGAKSSTYAKDDRWPWMVRPADGWLHVENPARFVNWHDEQARVNVFMSAGADGQLRLQTTRLIRKGMSCSRLLRVGLFLQEVRETARYWWYNG